MILPQVCSSFPVNNITLTVTRPSPPAILMNLDSYGEFLTSLAGAYGELNPAEH